MIIFDFAPRRQLMGGYRKSGAPCAPMAVKKFRQPAGAFSVRYAPTIDPAQNELGWLDLSPRASTSTYQQLVIDCQQMTIASAGSNAGSTAGSIDAAAARQLIKKRGITSGYAHATALLRTGLDIRLSDERQR